MSRNSFQAAVVSYGLLVRWQFLRLRLVLPLIIIVQAVLAVGVVIGFAFLVPQVDSRVALYLATGAPSLSLIVVGLATAPQLVAQAKLEGTLDYMRALPVPRLINLAADMTVWVLATLPGLISVLIVASLRFDIAFAVSWLVVPAFFLVAVASTAIGYGVAHAVSATATSVVSQLLVFLVLLFSPIAFPAERLPNWLQAVHQVLPFQSMATIVRGAVSNVVQLSAGPFLLVAAWGAAGLLGAHLMMARRA